MNAKLPIIISFTLIALTSVRCESREESEKREQVRVDSHIRAEWTELPPSVGKPEGGEQTMTLSALRILRAIDPKTEKPYDKTRDIFGCDPADLRRTFRLEKNEFLLGEPILVEFRIELDGPGEWDERIGGNYRARGRDDNFFFLMRHEDGTWVRDRYPPKQGYIGGGISSLHELKQNQLISYWHPVQRWCAVDRPGKYDLYCFQVAHGHTVVGRRQALIAALPDKVKKDHFVNADGGLIDSKTGKCSERYYITWPMHKWDASPLTKKIPADVVERAGKSWDVQNVMDFAHLRMVVRQGSDRERQQMVKYWTNIAESGAKRAMPTRRATAARQAICFAQQDDFLPLIEKWIATASQGDLCGLAMRPSPEATAMLLKAASPNAVAAMSYLCPDRIPDVLPQLIKWLTHEDQRMRAESEYRLHRWTGQAFSRDWKGYHCQRPTLEEGRKMQPMWQEWWDKNKRGFKPKTR